MGREFAGGEEGALEGLPLYLLILVVVAGIGTVTIMAFLPDRCTSITDIEIYARGGSTLLVQLPANAVATDYDVKVRDNCGEYIDGFTVAISGPGDTGTGTAAAGVETAQVNDLQLSLPAGDDLGTANLEAQRSGLASFTTTIPVVRS